MPFAVIKRGILGPEIIRFRIARGKPPAHLANASLALLRSAVYTRLGSRSRGTFVVLFIKGIGHTPKR